MKHHLITLTFLLLLSIFSIFSFWLLCPYNPCDVESPLIVLNDNHIVTAGEQLNYKVSVDKHTTLTADIHKQLISDRGFIVNYSTIQGMAKPGKQVVRISLDVPRSAESGKYRLKWEASYKVNPFRTIRVTVWSEYFDVISASCNE